VEKQRAKLLLSYDTGGATWRIRTNHHGLFVVTTIRSTHSYIPHKPRVRVDGERTGVLIGPSYYSSFAHVSPWADTVLLAMCCLNKNTTKIMPVIPGVEEYNSIIAS